MLFHLLYFFLNVTSPENWYTDPGSRDGCPPPGDPKSKPSVCWPTISGIRILILVYGSHIWYTDPVFGIRIPYLVYGSRDPVLVYRSQMGSRLGIPIQNGVPTPGTWYTDPKIRVREVPGVWSLCGWLSHAMHAYMYNV